MYDPVRFETPENVVLTYEIAGVGTRFVAWVFDVLLLFVLGLVLFAVTALLLVGFPQLGEAVASVGQSAAIFAITVIVGFAPIGYFLLAEILMQGQTPGKRSVDIRVVRNGGFGLTLSALFIRNLFRVLDTIPLLWFVPVLTKNGQRLGDMVAGTIVVQDAPRAENDLRDQLLHRPPNTATFRFTAGDLQRFTEPDLRAIETFLTRRATMAREDDLAYRQRLVAIVEQRLGASQNVSPVQERQLLEDLMATHYQSQLAQLE